MADNSKSYNDIEQELKYSNSKYTYYIDALRSMYRGYITNPFAEGLATAVNESVAQKVGFYLPSQIIVFSVYQMLSGPSCMIAVGLLGAIIQGRPSCFAQIELESQRPLLSALVGALNWNLCCMLTSIILGVTPCGAAGIAVGFCAATFLSSIMMCEVEQIACGPRVYLNKFMAKEAVHKSEDPCCQLKQ